MESWKEQHLFEIERFSDIMSFMLLSVNLMLKKSIIFKKRKKNLTVH